MKVLLSHPLWGHVITSSCVIAMWGLFVFMCTRYSSLYDEISKIRLWRFIGAALSFTFGLLHTTMLYWTGEDRVSPPMSFFEMHLVNLLFTVMLITLCGVLLLVGFHTDAVFWVPFVSYTAVGLTVEVGVRVKRIRRAQQAQAYL